MNNKALTRQKSLDLDNGVCDSLQDAFYTIQPHLYPFYSCFDSFIALFKILYRPPKKPAKYANHNSRQYWDVDFSCIHAHILRP